MKFKIKSIEQKGNTIQVVISHKDCERQVFSLPIDFAENNKYINEIKRILHERDVKKIKIDKSMIGKELEV